MTSTRDAGEIAVAFSRVLRGAGLAVPMSSTIAFAESLSRTGLDDRDTTFWAGRATLVRRPEDHPVFDRAFAVFWEHVEAGDVDLVDDEPMTITLAIDDDSLDGDDGPDDVRGV